MNNEVKLGDNFYWVGGSDYRLHLFENTFPIPNGMAYNSYLICDDKTVLIDGVDSSIRDLFIANVESVLDGRKLDYTIINHMEPDHCAVFVDLLMRYPDMKFIGNKKTITLLKQFYRKITDEQTIVVKEGDTFSTGKHSFAFYMAPMVHWPEVMFTYDTTNKVAFTADAFGGFGCLNGNLFFDELVDKETYINEARRYYTNIVGKYGSQANNALKKFANIEINMICSVHGAIWRKSEDINMIFEKYQKWANYIPEINSVCIVYGSIYGNTEIVAHKLAQNLAQKGISKIKMYDVSKAHYSYILSDLFRYSHIVFACSTYTNEMFLNMETLLNDFVSHGVSGRKIALMQNGSWAPQAGKLMKSKLEKLKDTEFIEPLITINSTHDEECYMAIDELSQNIYNSVLN